jgi:hypothetical protein
MDEMNAEEGDDGREEEKLEENIGEEDDDEREDGEGYEEEEDEDEDEENDQEGAKQKEANQEELGSENLPKGLPPRPITEYAKKYGVAEEDWLKSQGKSGFTPLPMLPAHTLLSVEEMYFRNEQKLYQEAELYDFDTATLQIMGCIEHQDARKSNLSALHPIFSRQRWRTKATLKNNQFFYPLPHGKAGHWTAENDEVWAVLRPCLCLASKFIMNAACWPWWVRLLISSDLLPPATVLISLQVGCYAIC